MTGPNADPLSDEMLQAIACKAVETYDDKFQGAVQILTRSENATFRLDAGGKKYALRIHRPGYHSKREIESELSWLDALREETGIIVPTSIPNKTGERVVEVLVGKGSMQSALRHVVLFDWVEGEMPTSDIDPAAFRRLGRITAGLHNHARGWQRPEGFNRIIWDHDSMVGPNGHWGDWREAPHLDADGATVIAAAMRDVGLRLARFGKGADRYGLIHADLRLTNLLLQGDDTRAIDFDDCGMGWFMHDLAAAISFEEHHPSAPDWVAQWIGGYEEIRAIDAAERAILPALIIQRRIQLAAWTGSHAGTEMVASLSPDWMAHTVRLARQYLANGEALPIGATSGPRLFDSTV